MQDIIFLDIMIEQKGEFVVVDLYGIKEENIVWDIGIYDDNLEVIVFFMEFEIKVCIVFYQ